MIIPQQSGVAAPKNHRYKRGAHVYLADINLLYAQSHYI